jgi:CDGSH iron-sulfur domain-containing protein 3
VDFAAIPLPKVARLLLSSRLSTAQTAGRNFQSPIRSKCSHWRKSPLNSMLLASWKVEMTHRSICFAGLPGSFARSTSLPAGLIILSSEKAFSRLFVSLVRITLEVSNSRSYISSTMRKVLKTANKPLEIKPQEKSVWICMCGLSKNQPYCDGSHKKVADEEDGKTYEYDSEGHRQEVTS